VLEQNIGHPVGLRDYLTLAWIISSMATVGGAIGSGLEDEEDVRAAAYGYHPTPGGWRDEQDEEDVRAAAYGYHPTPGGWRAEQDEEPDGR
jgi:hypothetical protein